MLRIYRKKNTFEKNSKNQGFKVFPQSGHSVSTTFGHTLPSTLQIDQIHKTMDQWEVDMLNTTRQHKAEMDTKIVALQLLTAEAGRQAQKLEQLIQQAQGSLLFQNTVTSTTQEELFSVQNSSSFPEPLIMETSVPEEIKIEDPFVDPDFEKTREELEQFSSRLEDLDLGLPDPFQAAEESPKMQAEASSLENVSPVNFPEPPKVGEQLGRATILRGLFPEFDEIHRKPAQKRPNIMFSSKSPIRTPRPPQMDSLLKSHSESGISKTDSAASTTVEIPQVSSPQAERMFGETDLSSTEKAAQMGIRHDNHHQVRFLAEKGLTSRDIASFLDMTVGEVEMILSAGPTTYRYPAKVPLGQKRPDS